MTRRTSSGVPSRASALMLFGLALVGVATAGCTATAADEPQAEAAASSPSAAATATASPTATGSDSDSDSGSDSGSGPGPDSDSGAIGPIVGSGDFPDGASAETPACQPAAAAAVAAVNAAMTVPDYGGDGVPFSLGSLSAAPDPAHAVWLLTGAVNGTGGGEGWLVVWATTADPTAEEFTGTLRSVGGQTAQISSAPALQFPDGDVAGGLPALALRCAAGATP